MTDYRYFVYGSWEKPEELWRVSGDDNWEYFAQPGGPWQVQDKQNVPPRPQARGEISAEQAARLQADPQRLVRYWVDRDVTPPVIYRRRNNPFRDEAFTFDNVWKKVGTIDDFLHVGPQQAPRLEEIDAATAERIVRETRGVSGATAL
jgi:hypothetical protein